MVTFLSTLVLTDKMGNFCILYNLVMVVDCSHLSFSRMLSILLPGCQSLSYAKDHFLWSHFQQRAHVHCWWFMRDWILQDLLMHLQVRLHQFCTHLRFVQPLLRWLSYCYSLPSFSIKTSKRLCYCRKLPELTHCASASQIRTKLWSCAKYSSPLWTHQPQAQ